MKCPNCNAEIDNASKVCPECGEAIPEEAVENEAVQAESAQDNTESTPESSIDNEKSAGKNIWDKIKELAKKCDSAITEKLGDKKMYAYAGVIGLVGIILVIAAIAAIIPNGNGYLNYGSQGELAALDDTVYLLKNNKLTEIKTSAETVETQKNSIDGKVTVFTSEGTLYALKGKKAVELAEDVASYTLSLYGDYVVYTVQDSGSLLYYHCKVSNGKSTEIFESDLENVLTSFAISPNGKNVAYVVSDGEDSDLYYFNGKKSDKVAECRGHVIGLSDGGKYIYGMDINDEGKSYLYSWNKNGKETKIDSCDAHSTFAFNLDATEVMFLSNGKTYVSAKAKDPIKAASSDLRLLIPEGVNGSYECGNGQRGIFYPVDTLFDHVYVSSGNGNAYFVSAKESKNVKLVKGLAFTLDKSGSFLYYMDRSDLMVLEIAKGEKAEDKAKLIAEDIYFYLVTSDRKVVYYVNEDRELYAVNGKKGGKAKKISSEEIEDAPILDVNDYVYFECDGDIYAAKGKKAGKKIMDSGDDYQELYGYVAVSDNDDNIYAARGTKKPKKLISID